jgi:hypothetical protein
MVIIGTNVTVRHKRATGDGRPYNFTHQQVTQRRGGKQTRRNTAPNVGGAEILRCLHEKMGKRGEYPIK